MDLDSARGATALSAYEGNGNETALSVFFAQYYETHPVNATFTGVHAYDTRLPDWSLAGTEHERAELEQLRARLQKELSVAHNDYKTLSSNASALDSVLALANLRLRATELSSNHFHSRNPALWTGEAIFGVVSLMIRDFAPASERLPAIASRLAAIPQFLSDMRERISVPVPERWRDRAVRECNAAVELFGIGLNRWIQGRFPNEPSDESANDLVLVRDAAKQACIAFTRAQQWINEFVVADSSAYAIGEQLFSEILASGHFCNEAPRTLLQRAERSLQSERVRFAELIDGNESVSVAAEQPGASVAQRQHLAQRLDEFDARVDHNNDSDHSRATGATDPDFDTTATTDPLRNWPHAQASIAADRPAISDYYESFGRKWREIHDAVVAHEAVTWPHWPIRYVPIPAWAQPVAPQLYWLFYRSPAPFDDYSTYEYVVTPIDDTMTPDEQAKRLSVWNHSAITLNHVVHHGGVGHHVQNWNAAHRSTSRIGTVAAVDCASRIGMFLGGSMAEGWACYATELVEELGLLTSLEIISQQHTRIRQVARAVVDIRLHSNDWSFAECATFYVRQSGMSIDMANAEVTKNSMFPGTALMYWLGTQGILDLREQMQKALGEQFNLRAFHDELLGRGSIPVPLVAKLMLSRLSDA